MKIEIMAANIKEEKVERIRIHRHFELSMSNKQERVYKDHSVTDL